MSAKLDIEDLPNHVQELVRRQIRVRTGRKRIVGPRTFTVEHERRYALRVCALVADLTQAQRDRVLRRALKVNDA